MFSLVSTVGAVEYGRYIAANTNLNGPLENLPNEVTLNRLTIEIGNLSCPYKTSEREFRQGSIIQKPDGSLLPKLFRSPPWMIECDGYREIYFSQVIIYDMKGPSETKDNEIVIDFGGPRVWYKHESIINQPAPKSWY